MINPIKRAAKVVPRKTPFQSGASNLTGKAKALVENQPFKETLKGEVKKFNSGANPYKPKGGGVFGKSGSAHMTLREFAKLAVEKEKEFKTAPSEKTVQDFFVRNPNPNDKKFHAFAEKNKVNTHKAEALAYRLATKQVKFQRGGKSNEPGPKHYDPKQMKAGIEVEAEHTPDVDSRKKISADHLSEVKNSRYYDVLRIAEKLNEKISPLNKEKQTKALKDFARSSESIRSHA